MPLPTVLQYVDELLSALGADGSQQVPVPSWHYEDGEAPAGGNMPLKQALAKCYDIRSPKAELFQLLWAALPDKAKTATNGKADVHVADKKSKSTKAAANAQVCCWW